MKYQPPLDLELIVDNFAGGGGASTGIEIALQRAVNIAINHDPEALQMHEANHPLTRHYCEDVWAVKPQEVTQGRPVLLAWFSPDCKHFSKAKGGKPVEKKIRGLAWVVLKWAATVKPRIIMLENVEEFTTWGPLVDNMPDPTRRGETFQSFKRALERHGYKVEHKELRACDYGAPTIRKRLFLIARRDGLPIVWPAPTHANPKDAKRLGLKPWRTAAECIDWSIEAPSIFAEGRKLLAENTLRRVAKGFKKFVLDAKKPFIVNLTHGGREESLSEPFKTITGANRGEKALVQPFLSSLYTSKVGEHRCHPLSEAMPTIMTDARHAIVQPFLAGVGGRMGQSEPRDVHTQPFQTLTAKADSVIVTPIIVGAGGAEYAGKPRAVDGPLNAITVHDRKAVIAPTLIEIGYGEAPGQAPRAPGLDKPLGTVVSGGRKHAVVASYLVRHFGTSTGQRLDDPQATVVSKSKDSLIAAYLAQHNNHQGVEPSAGRSIDEPLSTTTARGTQQGLIAAHITKLKGTCADGQAATDPLHTVAAGGLHHALTCAYLVKYYGNEKEAHGLESPAGTVTTKDRFGLVQVEGVIPPLTDDQRYNAWVTLRMLETFGGIDHPAAFGKDIPAPRPQFLMLGDYVLIDIGMRMLAPRELYTAQGFPKDYIIDRTSRGTPITKTAQVKMCGNSVSPVLSAALAKANVPRSFIYENRRSA